MKAIVRSLLSDDERHAAVAELAALRIAVFRDWPYLYDGSISYESEYLRDFSDAKGAVLVIAEHDGRIIGAATGSPMALQKAEFRDVVRDHGLDVDTIFYFGESVLLADYRGKGIGHQFFDAREEVARAIGATSAAFFAVIRPDDHALRPSDARDLTPFWAARGYAPVAGLTCAFDWKDIDQPDETSHAMQMWMRAL